MIGDANGHLISCYEFVRTAPEEVHKHLQSHVGQNSDAHYYFTRDIYNREGPSAARAAKFIYLNNTCFNGIFRVNMKGQFNVPYGWKTNPVFPTVEHLKQASEVLECAELRASPFETTVEEAGCNDFFYLDPPYPPLNGTAYFTHYTADRFGHKDQERLAEFTAELNRKGAMFLMTNADTPLIRELYGDFFLTHISVTRFVTCKSNKHSVDEVVITNYPTSPRVES